MDYSFLNFLALLGAVGLFLYGMKVMSEGLQKVAGSRLRSILSAMTRNRAMGVMTGVTITALIQSSSASISMVVGFVNAGLMTLGQSMAVILGANVGSTFTAWIVAFFGVSVNMSSFTLPLLAIAVPALFVKNNKYKSMGEFAIGFALLFMGLAAISANVPDLQSSPEVFSVLQQWTSWGFWSMLIFWFIGVVITLVIQSSAATFAIVMIMGSKGWIPFDMACALVLGSNVGTTITPLLASLGGNLAAKKAALSHLFFNLVTATWMIALFYPFVSLIEWITRDLTPFGDPTQLYQVLESGGTATPALISSMSWGLVIFHTLDKLINMFIALPFVNKFVELIDRVIKPKKQPEEVEFQLKYIAGGLLSTAELNLLAAQKEIIVMSNRVERMLGMVKTLLHTKIGSNEFQELYDRIDKYEDISDRMEIEIAKFLNRVVDGRLSSEGKMRVTTMLNIVSELESIGDSCNNLAKTLVRKGEAQAHFSDYNYQHIDTMFQYVSEAMSNMVAILCDIEHVTPEDLVRSYDKERIINDYRNECRNENIENVNQKVYPYSAGIFYIDIICEAEKLADYIVNVIDSVEEQMRHLNVDENGSPLIDELNPEKLKSKKPYKKRTNN